MGVLRQSFLENESGCCYLPAHDAVTKVPATLAIG